MSHGAISLDIKSTVRLVQAFSPNRAIMLRGAHGIGKSQVVYQIATTVKNDFYKDRGNCERVTAALGKDSGFVRAMAGFWNKNGSKEEYKDYPRNLWHYDMGTPVVERRLSQLTEGDMTGLPFEGNRGGTVFRACEWLLATTEFPCFLFLDELNRAIKGVEQATFQLADSKAFDGNTLHPDTRVIVAVNIGDEYDVQGMDLAALSRYATIDLEPTVEDWLAWAKENCHPALGEFIRGNPRFLEVRGAQEPNKKTPDRRAWGNLDAELRRLELYDSENCKDPMFVHMVASMVGFEAASALWKFVKEREADITAQDVLKSWEKVQKRLPKDDEVERHGKFLDMLGKLDNLLKTHLLTKEEAKNFAAFMEAAPPEIMMSAWKSLNQQAANLVKCHPYCGNLLVKRVAGGSVNTETTK